MDVVVLVARTLFLALFSADAVAYTSTGPLLGLGSSSMSGTGAASRTEH